MTDSCSFQKDFTSAISYIHSHGLFRDCIALIHIAITRDVYAQPLQLNCDIDTTLCLMLATTKDLASTISCIRVCE